jgi:GT2 family glycosyltransferase
VAECVDAVLAQAEIGEVVVVDNASRDGGIERLPADSRLRYLRNADNPGFAVACNQGAAATTAPWLLFVNPDCVLPPGALAALLAAWASRPRLGLVGAALINSDGSPQAASRRLTPTPARVLRGRRLDVPVGHVGEDGIELVEAVSGALMLLPRALFEQLGGFDTGYRLHCEDLDLCRRVLAGGHEVGLAVDVQVLHHKGTSSRRRPIWVEWQKHRGMWRYYSKFDRATTPTWLSLVLALGLAARFPLAAARAWWRAQRGS